MPLTPMELQKKKEEEAHDKKLDDSNNKVLDTLKGLNSTISGADKLINELAHKKVMEKKQDLVQK